MDGNMLIVMAGLATVSVFFTKGIIAGIVFFILDWVIIGQLIKRWNGDRQGAVDVKAGLPGGSFIFSVVTIALVIAINLFYH